VGDSHTDMELAHNAGLKGLLVKSGYGLGEVKYVLSKNSVQPEFIVDDLTGAVQLILDNFPSQ